MKRAMSYGEPGTPRTWVNARGRFSPASLASLEWTSRAHCGGRDPRPWFARWDQPAADRAREVCASCPVRSHCLGWALLCGDEYGIWGGLDSRQRIALEG